MAPLASSTSDSRSCQPGTAAVRQRFCARRIPFFYEPEFARAALAGTPPPPATPAGEQFAVAALLYQLTTGSYYFDFSMGRDAMLQEVIERPPVAFATRGLQPWPELEAVLMRGLAKEPADRFPSMAALPPRSLPWPPPRPLPSLRPARRDG
jgi:hypothetical protein